MKSLKGCDELVDRLATLDSGKVINMSYFSAPNVSCIMLRDQPFLKMKVLNYYTGFCHK